MDNSSTNGSHLQTEWDKLRKQVCWDESRVRELADVSAEAKRNGTKVHVGRVFDMCVEKNSELPPDNPNRKFKGRVVFEGCYVKDESNNWAIFAEIASCPAAMQAGRVTDAYGLMQNSSIEQAAWSSGSLLSLFVITIMTVVILVTKTTMAIITITTVTITATKLAIRMTINHNNNNTNNNNNKQEKNQQTKNQVAITNKPTRKQTNNKQEAKSTIRIAVTTTNKKTNQKQQRPMGLSTVRTITISSNNKTIDNDNRTTNKNNNKQ